jgi:hypothetical protein
VADLKSRVRTSAAVGSEPFPALVRGQRLTHAHAHTHARSQTHMGSVRVGWWRWQPSTLPQSAVVETDVVAGSAQAVVKRRKEKTVSATDKPKLVPAAVARKGSAADVAPGTPSESEAAARPPVARPRPPLPTAALAAAPAAAATAPFPPVKRMQDRPPAPDFFELLERAAARTLDDQTSSGPRADAALAKSPSAVASEEPPQTPPKGAPPRSGSRLMRLAQSFRSKSNASLGDGGDDPGAGASASPS